VTRRAPDTQEVAVQWVQGLFLAAAGSAFVLAGAHALLARRMPARSSGRWFAVAWAGYGAFVLLGGVVGGVRTSDGTPISRALAYQWVLHAVGVVHSLALVVGARRLADARAERDAVAPSLALPRVPSADVSGGVFGRTPITIGAVSALASLALTVVTAPLDRATAGLVAFGAHQLLFGIALLVAARTLAAGAPRTDAAGDADDSARFVRRVLVTWGVAQLAGVAVHHLPRLLGAPLVDGMTLLVLMPVLDVCFASALGVGLVLAVLEERARLAASLAAMQAQAVRAEQFATLGRVAGGIAHDFANVLQIMRVQVDFVSEQVTQLATAPALMREDVHELRRVMRRAEVLLGELRTIDRRAPRVQEPVDAVALVGTLAPSLERLLGPGVTLRVEAAPDVPPLRGNTTDLERVLVNLVANARDAMPAGGTVTVRVAECATGTGVQLSVRDTGTGMSEAVRARVFEPFFTTKGERGMGLGLPTVLGIVQQGGGRMRIDSAPGEGTTVSLVLPRAAASADGAAVVPDAARATATAVAGAGR
jgi:signal transduction histidine kinase